MNKGILSRSKIKNSKLVETRRAQICRAAEELFAQKGYHNTSMRDIAAKSNVSIGSLYDYIKNKEDILYLLANEFFDHLRREVMKILDGGYDVVRQLEGTIEAMLRVVDRFQEYTLFTYRDSRYLKREDLRSLMEQEAFFNETFTKIIGEGIQEGIFEIQEPEIVANMLTVLTHSWALKRYNLRKFSLYAFREVLLELVLKGLIKHKRGDLLTNESHR